MQIKNQRPLPKPRQCLPSKRIRLGVEFGAESLTGIFLERPRFHNSRSIWWYRFSCQRWLIVIDFKDRNDCNSTSDEPRKDQPKPCPQKFVYTAPYHPVSPPPRGVHPLWDHNAFPPCFRFSPISETISDFQNFFFNFSHRPQIWNFPPIFAVSVHFPSVLRIFFFSSPTFTNFTPVLGKFTSFSHTLCVFFPPTLTMMHLCITQCTYWTPLTISQIIIAAYLEINHLLADDTQFGLWWRFTDYLTEKSVKKYKKD